MASSGIRRLLAGKGIKLSPPSGQGEQVTISSAFGADDAVTQIIPGLGITISPPSGKGPVVVSAIPISAPSLDAFYLVNQAANMPPNGIDLSTFGPGVLQQTVTGGVASISAANAPGSHVPFGAGDGTLTWDDHLQFFPPFPGFDGALEVTCPVQTPEVNNTGASILIGTNTANSVEFMTSRSTRGGYDSTGIPFFSNLGTTGGQVVAYDGAGRIKLDTTAAPLLATSNQFFPSGIDLGALSPGLLQITVSGGVATVSTTTVSGGINQLTGDVTAGPGTGSQAATLATVNSSPGTFAYPSSLTVNGKGLVTSVTAGSTPIFAANNLSDLASAATARTNLGLGTAATHAASDFLQAANNLSDVASAATARTNLDLVAIASSGSAADLTTGTLPAGRFPALTGDITTTAGSVATTIANSAVTYAKIQNVTNARVLGNVSGSAHAPMELTASDLSTLLGLGTAATHAASDFLQAANNLSDVANAGTARTNLGLGTAATHAASDFLQAANNLSDVASASTARTNLGLGSAAVHPATDFEVPLTFSTGLTRATNTITANLSTGVSGGQTAIGGTASGDSLTLSSTSNGTKGKTIFGSTSGFFYDEANNVLAMGAPTPATGVAFHLQKNQNAGTYLYLGNNSTGTSANIGVLCYQNANFTGPAVGMFMMGAATSGFGSFYPPNTGVIQLNGGAANLVYNVGQSSGDHVWITGTTQTERMRLTNAGVLSIKGLSSNGFVKTTGGTGALTVDTTTYQPALSLTATNVLFSGGGLTVSQDNAFNYVSGTHTLSVPNVAVSTATVDAAVQGGAGSVLALNNAASPTTSIALTSSNIQIGGDVALTGGLAPSADATYSLGASGKSWGAIWVDTLAKAGAQGTISFVPSQGIQIDSNTSGCFLITHQSTNGRFISDATGIAFFPLVGGGTLAGVAQQTVTGSRGGNAALASLLTKLANYGLIVDGTSP